MKQQIIQHKSNATDGLIVVGGTSYAVFAEVLPVIIGVLTALLFIYRLFIAHQEYKINKLTIHHLEEQDALKDVEE